MSIRDWYEVGLADNPDPPELVQCDPPYTCYDCWIQDGCEERDRILEGYEAEEKLERMLDDGDY